MKKIIYILSFVALSAAASAQPYIDIASVYFQQSPGDNMSRSKSSMNTQLTSVFLNLPLQIDSDYIVINPVYENYRLDVSSETDPINLTAVYMPLAWVHQFKGSKWSTTFMAIPRLSSDLVKPVDGNDFQMGGIALATWKKKETLKYSFGAYYNSEFFGGYYIPLLGIDWNITGKWNLFGTLPINLNLEYKMNKTVHAGFGLNLLTNSYRIEDKDFLRIDDYNAKFILDIYMMKNQVISVEAGHSLFRQYRMGAMDGGKPDYMHDLNVSDGCQFRLSYIFRIRTDK
jgi:hypothetical protein